MKEQMRWKIELRNKEKNQTEGDEAACKLQALYRGRLERRSMRQWVAQLYCKVGVGTCTT